MDQSHRLGRSPALTCLSIWLFVAIAYSAAAASDPLWPWSIGDQIKQVDERYDGELGVYIRDLDSGASYSYRAEETWYLASTVKIPVAVTVLQAIDDGRLALGSKVTLQPQDFVDGAGQTNWHSPGDQVEIAYLLEQMVVYSDNTATDVLIRTVGVDAVNELVKKHVLEGVGEITTLADVRRHAYSAFHENAFNLKSGDLFTIKKSGNGDARVNALAKVLGVSRNEFAVQTLDEAFAIYYHTGLNSGRLSAYSRFLEKLVNGDLLEKESQAYLLNTMERIKTGDNRIVAGLPPDVSFAHKTGTQYRRACNIGIATHGDGASSQRVIIAVCARGTRNLTDTERAMRQVGEAITRSGIFSESG
ncbi:serine hydrolase [Marinobacter fonticola]|uniref:serine hydrolase n=1 Tax=Marinobacter fonticola TaxID=2603215 RepID=UPI0011E7D310|nr:serine hydrolase [Marinobacter fonticola]